jgi:hypothetical protein
MQLAIEKGMDVLTIRNYCLAMLLAFGGGKRPDVYCNARVGEFERREVVDGKMSF